MINKKLNLVLLFIGYLMAGAGIGLHITALSAIGGFIFGYNAVDLYFKVN